MEVESYACHINAYLGNDPFLKDVLPIHPQNFFDAVKDGVLLCKLINLAVPGTIDERAINSKGSLTPQDKIDNHTLFLMSAMAIGLTSDITVGELAEAGSDALIGLISEIIKIQLLADVNLIRTPGLLELAENNQDSEKLMRAPPDMLLLKWINHMFRKGGVCRRVSNFSSDMKDSSVYAYLLDILVPGFDVKSSAMQKVGYNRADFVLKIAKGIGCKVFLSPDHIVHGVPTMNLAFVAQIFHRSNGLSNKGIPPPVNQTLHEIEVSREKRFYQLWINSLGISTCIYTFFEDLKDGWVLLQLFDKVSPKSVDWSIANRGPIAQPSKMMENCNQVLQIARKLKFYLPGISGMHIFQGRKTAVLMILWELKKHYMRDRLKNCGFVSREVEITGSDILACANKKVEGSNKNTSKIESFQDKSLSDGTFFLSLLNAVGPHTVNWSHVTQGQNEQEKKSNASYLISVARKLGCPVFLLPEDILDVKPEMMICFTADILTRELELSASNLLTDENGSSCMYGISVLSMPV
ncbi:hypothetical protein HU200_036162 [Digitaria exilis]|uniref:Calponin-homology (CH) domain-containing protein n=1 Tax=Digitaria exilis TaxID=1010633 RepID=A0A835BGS2_9POAL|nr:hypothetical protein HU200_036162 [Digitaria exilis]